MKQKLGVAVVGLGVGEQHARAYASNENCELKLLYDINATKTNEVISKLGAGRASVDLEQILSDKTVDIVSIASYDDAHFEQVIKCLNANKHVFVEKPMCRNKQELRSIKYFCEKNKNIKLASNLVLRAAPLYKWLKQQISDGAFGEIYSFDGEYLFGRIHKITEGWRGDVENYSVIEGGGVHLIDLMVELTGQKPNSVYAVGNKIATAETKFKYDDYVSATYMFKSGMIGRITANFGCVHKHQHVVRIFGTKASFIYDDRGARMHISRDPLIRAWNIDIPALPYSKGELIPEFVDSIIHDKDVSKHIQHEFDIISICSAADKALTVERKIEVDYV